MTADDIADAIRKLDAIEATSYPYPNPEQAHKEVDAIVVGLLPAEVRDAYQRVLDSFDGRWWYA